MDGLGPNGETIMDYSIYDAIRAGFGKIVFVIRKDFEEQFRTQILSKYEGKIPAELVFQSLDALPEGFTCPEGRVKPWGTNHAVLMGKDVIKEPFCVINCDDFYGRDAFATIGKFLSELPEGCQNTYAMVGFRCCNTLSENGSVARGVCMYDDHHHLKDVVERTEIMRVDGPICYKDEEGKWIPLEENVPVSMNMWGFTPSFAAESEARFPAFLDRALAENPMKGEYFLPSTVSALLAEDKATVKMLYSPDKWYGVTYAADKPVVVAALKAMTEAGLYPDGLWK